MKKKVNLSYGTDFYEKYAKKNGEKTLLFVLHPKQINILTFVISFEFVFFIHLVPLKCSLAIILSMLFVLRQMRLFVNWVHLFFYLKKTIYAHFIWKVWKKTSRNSRNKKTLLLRNILIRCKPKWAKNTLIHTKMFKTKRCESSVCGFFFLCDLNNLQLKQL